MATSPTYRRHLPPPPSINSLQSHPSRHMAITGGGARRVLVPQSTAAMPSANADTVASPVLRPAATTAPPPTQRINRTIQSASAHASHSAAAAVASSMPPAQPKETNIQVVVRCRDRNEREIAEGDKPIISCRGGREIDVKWTPPRSFYFDKVFGPGAAQEVLYEDVVRPIVVKVLQGFSCTIFAYGQTGTGKTYTMEGDIGMYSAHDHADLSPHAGLIPRALHQIYEDLEASGRSFEVRVSYVEIYQEELRCLLSSGDGANRKIRLFDDRKGGVAIEGISESVAETAGVAIDLLRHGAQNREVAATRSNDASSRSHAIFTITVYMYDTAPSGENLMIEGKLNLVDLAGSENIRRSGAVQDRAREAGEINKSLLTLGRVINALVDNASHVPYRESKLTRILQDSLGGRTMTCIIATVSPVRGCVDETLSTLDYASRAKNIRNKPVANKRLTKKALIKEYIAEIERLKSELQANRDKHGVYLTQDKYMDLAQADRRRREEGETLKLDIKELEGRLQKVTQQFQHQLTSMSEAKDKLGRAETQLQHKDQTIRLKDTDIRAQRHVVLEQAKSGRQLSEIAQGLIATARASAADVQRLHEKIERKTHAENANLRAFKDFQDALLDRTTELESLLSVHHRVQVELGSKIHAYSAEFARRQVHFAEEQSTALTERLARFESDLSRLESVTRSSEERTADFATSVAQVKDDLRQLVREQTQSNRESVELTMDRMRQELSQHCVASSNWLSTLRMQIYALRDDMAKRALEHQEAASRMATECSNTSEEQDRRYREVALRMNQDVTAKMKRMEEKKNQMLDRVAGLFSEFVKEQRTDLQSTANDWHREFNQQRKHAGDFSKRLAKESRRQALAFHDFGDSTAARLATMEEEVAADSYNDMEGRVVEITSDVVVRLESQTKSVDCAGDAIDGLSKTIQDMLASAAKSQETLAVGVRASMADTARQTEGILDLVKQEATSMSTALANHADNMTAQVQTHYEDMSNRILLTQDDIRLLAESRIQKYQPTGQTPLKREYPIPDYLPVFRTHEDIIREFRETGDVSVPGAAPHDSEDDGEDDDKEDQFAMSPKHFKRTREQRSPPAEISAPLKNSEELNSSPGGSDAPVRKKRGVPDPFIGAAIDNDVAENEEPGVLNGDEILEGLVLSSKLPRPRPVPIKQNAPVTPSQSRRQHADTPRQKSIRRRPIPTPRQLSVTLGTSTPFQAKFFQKFEGCESEDENGK